MLRLAIFMIGGGAMLTYVNAKEFLLDRRASAKPESVKLADLEQGKEPSNPHIMIGPHLAVYSVGVYEYEKRSRDEAITPSTEIKAYYYPLISEEHPFVDRLRELVAKHGGVENVPDDAPWPVLTDFRVLVKTTRFSTYGSIPEEMMPVDSVQGVVINSVDPLDSETIDLLRQQFSGVDPDKVLVLEDGRKPSSMGWSIGRLGLSVALLLAGLFMIIPRRSSRDIDSGVDPLDASNPYAAPSSPVPPVDSDGSEETDTDASHGSHT